MTVKCPVWSKRTFSLTTDVISSQKTLSMTRRRNKHQNRLFVSVVTFCTRGHFVIRYL